MTPTAVTPELISRWGRPGTILSSTMERQYCRSCGQPMRVHRYACFQPDCTDCSHSGNTAHRVDNNPAKAARLEWAGYCNGGDFDD